jgi:hypothetical protein
LAVLVVAKVALMELVALVRERLIRVSQEAKAPI